jgi:phosphoglucomutase
VTAPVHRLAGKLAPPEVLIDVVDLERAYYERCPDPADPLQRVAFGTSGHRGSAPDGSFNEAHIVAITQAICEYRAAEGIDGPLFLGKDTHALSGPAQRTAVEVLAANGVTTVLQRDDGFTPTPVVSRAILVHNRDRAARRADGIVVTPSHNPPADGGFKYNPPHGGPAESAVTGWIERRANELLASGVRGVRRVPYPRALKASTTHADDFLMPYIADLATVVDLDVVRDARVRLGVDPLGGSAVRYWQPIADTYGLDIAITNPAVDPTFRFMTLDRDGKIRMDCSSPWAMASLLRFKDRFPIAFGNDADCDRHGIVTPAGLMNPNHYLAVAVRYLLTHRPSWPAGAAVGKTVVTSSMIDRVAASLGRTVAEVPVGFKWFVDGLLASSLCFGGEESAGASFLRRDGTVWTTDKDGMLLALLAAEITARTGKDPAQHYAEITAEHGTPYYVRIDAAATPAQKKALAALSADAVAATELAGEKIVAKLTHAGGAPIGGLKVVTGNGWFAARPSGTENVYKLYAESFRSEEHLRALVEEAQRLVDRVV